MELSKQCVSLELAKRLKELGVRQESLYSWSNYSLVGWRLELVPPVGIMHVMTGGTKGEVVSAFTSAELGEMLAGTEHILPDFHRSLKVWYAPTMKETIEADTEADARAKMLIHLLEQKLITL